MIVFGMNYVMMVMMMILLRLTNLCVAKSTSPVKDTFCAFFSSFRSAHSTHLWAYCTRVSGVWLLFQTLQSL